MLTNDSLLVALPTELDAGAVERIRYAIAGSSAGRIRVDASALHTLDPVGISRLWFVLWSLRQRRNVGIEVEGLHPSLRRQLRIHPLLDFLRGEEDGSPHAEESSAFIPSGLNTTVGAVPVQSIPL